MARSKKKDSETVPGRKTLYENHLYTEEPTMALKSNVGLTARILGTCCLGAAPASTKSPIGTKPNIAGAWEDCPAFDLEPLPSRQGSVSTSVTAQGRGRKLSGGNRCELQQSSQQQVPLGEGDQGLESGMAPGSPSRAAGPPVISASNGGAFSPATNGCTPLGVNTPFATPGGGTPTATGGGTTPTQDSAADMYNDAEASPQGPESPSPHQRDRQTMQHRVALRLLERRGVFGDGASSGGRSSNSGGGSIILGADGAATAASQPSSGSGALASGSRSGSFPQLPVVPGAGGAMMLLSPSSGRTSAEYQTAAGSLADMPYESAVEVDERLCLQDDGADVDADMPPPLPGHGYRTSAPGLPGRRDAWGWPDATARPISRVRAIGGVEEQSDGDGMLRVRASDFGGVVGGLGIGGGAYPHRGGSRRLGVAAGVHRVASLGIVDGGTASDDPRISPVRPVAASSEGDGQTWSAAGGRMELSQEEKEWLFGQPGGIGGLAPVMALGEGGEGLVDLVRLELPTRTLHLARKATRTSLPVYALLAAANGTVGTAAAAAAALAIGVRTSQTVSYRFPFEFFDREVRAMKAVKDSGFVIRFQAAAYNHDAGQGFILMEAAPYGTLEDLHGALCRSQLQPVQRQRPALLQRAIARFNFGANAKGSAPPSLAMSAAAAASSPDGAAQCQGGAAVVCAGGGGLLADRPSIPRVRMTPGGIGSCGGTALDMAEEASPAAGGGGGAAGVLNDRLSCCSKTSTAVTSPYGAADAAAPGRTSRNTPGAAAAAGCIGALGSSLMSTRALRYYGACMLQALVALHDAGYVYRDLKLSNVLVCEGGRVRLTDFGAAATCLPDQPGLFGGAAGTRAYLAPEVLPWLEPGAKAGGGKKGGGGAEPYTVTVDSWTWGLVMVELATGWSLKELTNRIIRRVCHPKSPEPPDFPPDCGLPPTLRQLLLDHVLVRDHRERWTAARIRSHRFFEGIDWEGLTEVEGPHVHLFARNRALTEDPAGPEDSPADVATALLAAEAASAGGRTSNRVTASGKGPGGVAGGGWGELQVAPAGPSGSSSNGGGGGGNGRISPVECAPAGSAPRGGSGSSRAGNVFKRPSFTGHGGLTVTPPGGGAGVAAAATARSIGSGTNSPLLSPAAGVSYISPASSLGGAGSHRLSSTGFAGAGTAAGARVSSPGGGVLIGPVVLGLSSPAGSAGGGTSPGGGVVTGRRTSLAGPGGSRLAPTGALGA